MAWKEQLTGRGGRRALEGLNFAVYTVAVIAIIPPCGGRESCNPGSVPEPVATPAADLVHFEGEASRGQATAPVPGA